MPLTETAFAKINLALHVRARREDGYHEIETLFAFVDNGDRLMAHEAEADRFSVTGEFADLLDNPFDNLVARALTALPRTQGLDITLEKNVPVAAGLGGGSADAGALFRIVKQMFGLPENWEEKAERLGADVPACVASTMAIGRGTGTKLGKVTNNMRAMPVLLVNPRVPLPTGPVFQAWDGEDRGPLPKGTARTIAKKGRNDLRDQAIAICPPIADVLARLEQTEPFMHEMSGSGATCFAIYKTQLHRDRAARAIAEMQPGWWQMTGQLR